MSKPNLLASGKLGSSVSVTSREKSQGIISKLESTSAVNISNSVNIDVNSEDYKDFHAYLKFKKNQAYEHTSTVYGQSTSVSSQNNDAESAGKMENFSHTQPKAAVDDKVQLPEFAKFTGKSISTDAYISWKRVVVDAIDGSPRYRPLLQGAEEDWMDFQRANSKYAVEHIEMYYLDAHRQLWSMIGACFDNDIITSIAEEMKTEALDKSLPNVLGFSYCTDYKFYKNVKVFLEKLSKRYEVKSGWEMCNLLKQFTQLEFNPEENPINYMEGFMLNYRKILTLEPEFSIPDDMLAYLMLSQLPLECQAVKSQFLDVNNKPSLSKLKAILLSWWQSRVKSSVAESVSEDSEQANNDDIIDSQIE
jgi:hypothetical protein